MRIPYYSADWAALAIDGCLESAVELLDIWDSHTMYIWVGVTSSMTTQVQLTPTSWHKFNSYMLSQFQLVLTSWHKFNLTSCH